MKYLAIFLVLAGCPKPLPKPAPPDALPNCPATVKPQEDKLCGTFTQDGKPCVDCSPVGGCVTPLEQAYCVGAAGCADPLCNGPDRRR